ncbi:MFS transporter [Actinokineospora sp. HUAS TT18]|uniref:MFS transporter n=1 Tax=Actinokineospora sp. HUAS TT18 TaxID=3447451 RepID=UPI003F527502
MTHVYRECLGQRHAKWLIVTNLVGRLPNGMAPLAIALFLREQGFSYGIVGGLVGLFAVATAIGGPLLGRVVDRRGQTAVLVGSAVVSAGAFTTLALADKDEIWWAALDIFIAGLLTPPLEPCLRSLWPDVMPGERALNAAYALDAALQEVLYVVGPLLVIGVVAAVSPTGAVLTIAAVTIVGTLAFVASPPVRRWRGHPSEAGWLGPLRSGQLRVLLLALCFVGFVLGVFSIAVVGYAESVGDDSVAGVLLGAHAFGALIGGLAYGARTWWGGARRQLPWLLGALTLSYVPLVLVGPPTVMAALMVLAGLFLSPVLAAGFIITGQVAPKGTATEAFAWLVSIILVGNAAGAAVAGFAQPLGQWAVFVLPILGALAALGVVAMGKLARESAEEKVDEPVH